MKNRECVSCIKRKTPYCPTSIECMATEDMPYYQDRMMLLKENQELKKQVEERKYYKFYKYENNPCGSDYCFCERPCDSNMNLKCFFENGEICGFMSETLVSNHITLKKYLLTNLHTILLDH